MLQTLIERKLVVFIICIIILGAGIFSSFTLPIRLIPDLVDPVLRIEAWVDHDVEPEKLEKEVVIPIETIVLNSPYVHKVDASTNTKNVSMSIVYKGTATQQQQEDVKREVEKKLNELPFKLDGKSVHQFTAEDMEMMVITIIPENIEDIAVRNELENVVIPALKQIPNVKEVYDQLKKYDTHYSFEIKPEAIKGVQKTAQLVEEVRRMFSSTILGTLSYHGDQVPVRSEPDIVSVNQFHQLKLSDGSRLADQVDIQVKTEASSIYRYVNGQPYYLLTIKVPKGTSEVKVAKLVRDKLEQLHENKTTSWDYRYIWDSSLFIGQAVQELITNILIGAVLAVIILLIVYRSIRTMLVIGLSIPICIMSTMIAMDWFNYSINLISLIGLGIGTGMIVDACIVVLDNIFSKIQKGMERKEAVIEGTKEVFSPVLSSVLTTISVFVPIAILEGQIGMFMNQMALTVTMALLSSLLVAFIIIPIFSLRFIKVKEQAPHFASTLNERFIRFVTYCLNRKWRTLFVFILALITSIALLVVVVPKGFMSPIQERALYISYDIDEKTDPDISKELITVISKKIQQVEGVKEVFYEINEPVTHNGMIYVHYLDENEMTRKEEEVNQDIIKLFDQEVPATAVRISTGQSDTSGQTMIAVKSSSMEAIVANLPSIVEELSIYPGVTSVDSSISEKQTGWVIRFSDEQLQKQSLTKTSVEQYISMILHGVKDVDISLNGVSEKANITFPEYYLKSSEALFQLPLDENKLTTIASVAEVKTNIIEGTRMRSDGLFQSTIKIHYDETNKQEIIKLVEKYMNQYPIQDIGLSFLGSELQQAEGFQDLIKALVVSIVSVMLILIIQFNSIRQPFIIFISLIFTVIGVTIGFLVTARTFDIMAMIGLVMLAGIVVNNAIVLIDFINKNRERYETLREAVLQAVRSRIRPIFTTTITTASGLTPMFIGGTATSNFQTPIATSVIFGLLFSTFISLVLVPVLYEFFEGRRERRLKEKLEKMKNEPVVETTA
ncbi:efflux RND transporter permease subunit [Caldalkalibacillus mannanilyticus]|uniref:efflux RND transporter permease subunit n=1 Tax=Caldalkalibacillus mannanilyticus TaxID=1418 RepID=UPI000468360A|nr:efflux RND transporter permease subunit [Caldalkalibacillus mannanilyticus]